ncbi:hypothetical protein SKA23_14075, partial [Enterococcus faecium]
VEGERTEERLPSPHPSPAQPVPPPANEGIYTICSLVYFNDSICMLKTYVIYVSGQSDGESDGEQEELPPPPANRMKRPANEGFYTICYLVYLNTSICILKPYMIYFTGDSGILRPRTMIHGKQFYENTPTSGHIQKLPHRKK